MGSQYVVNGSETIEGMGYLQDGAIIPAGQTLTNNGAYAGIPVVTSITAGSNIVVTNPSSPGAAAVSVTLTPAFTTVTASGAITAANGTTGAEVINYTQATNGSINASFGTIAASGAITGPQINPNPAAGTAIAGTTAGTITPYIVELGTIKKYVYIFAGYENDTTTNQVLTFSTAFINVPTLTNSTGLTLTPATTGITITAPDSVTLYSGTVVAEGI